MSEKIDMEFARRDDCLERMVPSDLRLLIGERDKAEAEAQALREELAALRARVVVLPSVDNVMNIVMRYQWNEKTNVTGTTNWAANLGMRVVEEVKRLNGLTVSADAIDTLRRFATGEVGHLNNGLCPDDLEGRETRDPNCSVCRALIETEKENGNG
ncbi:hypothetical protein ACP9NB_31205 [Pseudomonas aeruginosa]|uniref:hypothetical protein n=1 Tax=Pseudomonas aeruginosa TaxID=287 RepID=UPI003CEB65B2